MLCRGYLINQADSHNRNYETDYIFALMFQSEYPDDDTLVLLKPFLTNAHHDLYR